MGFLANTEDYDVLSRFEPGKAFVVHVPCIYAFSGYSLGERGKLHFWALAATVSAADGITPKLNLIILDRSIFC
jgi:hypothetical protein